MLNLHEQLHDAAEFMQAAQHIVTLTGAGISTESGIPDFRSPGSIWRSNPPVSYQAFINSPQARKSYWETRKSLLGQVSSAQPNAAHQALTGLQERGILRGVITQNFDGLHQDAGIAPEHVVELHGTSRLAACTLCGRRSPMPALQARIDSGEIDPQCELCGGFLKAATILFGQRVPDDQLARARAMIDTCDLMLVIGSSLKVTPAATLPRLALTRNVPLIIVNMEATSLDSRADVVIHEKAGIVLPSLVAMV